METFPKENLQACPRGFLKEFHPVFKEKCHFTQTLPETETLLNPFYFTKPALSWYQNLKDKLAENDRLISLVNPEAEILSKILTNRIWWVGLLPMFEASLAQ